jgi:hypothetical protein
VVTWSQFLHQGDTPIACVHNVVEWTEIGRLVFVAVDVTATGAGKAGHRIWLDLPRPALMLKGGSATLADTSTGTHWLLEVALTGSAELELVSPPGFLAAIGNGDRIRMTALLVVEP